MQILVKIGKTGHLEAWCPGMPIPNKYVLS